MHHEQPEQGRRSRSRLAPNRPAGRRHSESGSSLLDGFGAVTPRQRPEDFAAIRAEFERGVAEEASRWLSP